MPMVITPLMSRPKMRLRSCRPTRYVISVGTSSTPIADGNSQRGPMTRSACRARYSPPTARIAMSAGHLGSGGRARDGPVGWAFIDVSVPIPSDVGSGGLTYCGRPPVASAFAPVLLVPSESCGREHGGRHVRSFLIIVRQLERPLESRARCASSVRRPARWPSPGGSRRCRVRECSPRLSLSPLLNGSAINCPSDGDSWAV
jgi:hypothetical protein